MLNYKKKRLFEKSHALYCHAFNWIRYVVRRSLCPDGCWKYQVMETARFPGYSVPLLIWGNTHSPVVAFLQISSHSSSFCHFIQLFLLSSARLIPCVQPPQGSLKSSSVNEFCKHCVCAGQLSAFFFPALCGLMCMCTLFMSYSMTVNTLKRWLGICVFIWVSVEENVLLWTSVKSYRDWGQS